MDQDWKDKLSNQAGSKHPGNQPGPADSRIVTTDGYPDPLADDEDDDPFLGRVIDGKYEMTDLLGGGGAGLVYKATHVLMKKTVAVKVLFPHLCMKQEIVKRFQQEAESSSRLDHPNIVSVHDFGITSTGQPYLVMDYVKGRPLDEVLEKRGSLPISRAVDIMQQACDALAHAHSRNVVHRDLKPSNMMLTKGDNGEDLVKVVDFGLAKAFDREGQPLEKLTQTGEVFGSPAYMSPEQCKGLKVDYRTDIYAMGCILFEVLSGRMAFTAETAVETLVKQMNEAPPPLSIPSADPQVVSRLEEVTLRALAKDPNRRYQSMTELKDNITQAMKSTIIGGATSGLKVKYLKWFGYDLNVVLSRKKIFLILPLLIIVGAVVMFMYVVFADNGDEDKGAAAQIVRWQVEKPKPTQTISTDNNQLGELIYSLEQGDKRKDALQEMGRNFMKAQQYDKAEPKFRERYDLCLKEDGTASEITSNAALDLANCYFEQGKFKEAQDKYATAIGITKGLLGKNSDFLALPHSRLGQCYLAAGMTRLAQDELAEAIRIWTDHHKTETVDFAMALSSMAQAYDQDHNGPDAIDYYQRAAQAWLKFSGVERRNAIRCDAAIAAIADNMNKGSLAHKAYLAACQLTEQEFGKNSLELAVLLNRDAGALMRRGDFLQGLPEKVRAKLILWNSPQS
jgi:serine/threonine protein kinase/tetratricopeptide (TPR) repeat protein